MTKDEDSTKVGLLKDIIEGVVSFGVGAAIGNVIRTNTPQDSIFIKRLSIRLGAFVISRMLSEQARNYTDKKIDKIVYTVQPIIDLIKEEDIVEGEIVDEPKETP